jgi:hypothetical protein
LENEGESLAKALRSEAGMVPLGVPRGERSEDRERIFHAGKNSSLSQGLSRVLPSLFVDSRAEFS